MTERADITFGTQLDKITERHTYYTQFFYRTGEISAQFPELKDHEAKMVNALGNAVAERMQLMGMYGSGGLAAEIVENRRKPIPRIGLEEHIAQKGDY